LKIKALNLQLSQLNSIFNTRFAHKYTIPAHVERHFWFFTPLRFYSHLYQISRCKQLDVAAFVKWLLMQAWQSLSSLLAQKHSHIFSKIALKPAYTI